MKNHSSQDTTLDISIIGLMSALVFVGTYFFKIPSAFGYTHLGDCMIILTVCLFGTRRGVLAGAIGAGLSDFLGGYAVWVLPTMVLKGTSGNLHFHGCLSGKCLWLSGQKRCDSSYNHYQPSDC